MAFGLYVVVGLPLAWLPSNQPRYGKRTTATGLQLTIGNTSGIMAPFVSQIFPIVPLLLQGDMANVWIQLYPTAEGPRYVKGHAVTLGLVSIATFIYGFMWWILARKNAARRDGKEDNKIINMSDEEIAEWGDASPRFMYTV